MRPIKENAPQTPTVIELFMSSPHILYQMIVVQMTKSDGSAYAL